jgi:uncharacterized coiled-coil protein SlyX
MDESENPGPDRLQQLEAAVTHLERQYDELNAIVIRQDKQLTRLISMFERVDDAFQSMEMEKIRSNNAKPPHYGDAALG